jgi:uncharacterized protein (DUF433 family)
MAARLLAAKPAKVRAWVEGYGHSDATPILIRELPRVGGKTVLSFLDLVEAAFVRHFRAIGYSPQTIRKVALKLRDRTGNDHPFAMEKRFKADGKHIFEEVVADDGERRLVSLMDDNFVMVSAVEPALFEQVFYVEDVAREFIPLRNHPEVIINPRISFGRPIIKKVGVPTEKLYAAFLSEGGIDEVSEEFGIDPLLVAAAINFETQLTGRIYH